MSEKRTARWALWLPLGVFAAFVVLVSYGLIRPKDDNIASAMVGKPLPSFNLRPAVPERPGLSTDVFEQGEPRLLNIFASWCIPCALESRQLDQLRARGAQIDGIAIRDRPADVAAFLERNGNPFSRIGADDVSAVQMGIGSSGVPETFVIDGKGVIRHQHIGVIRPEDVPLLLDKLHEAKQ